jgi:glycosyltransferase involved in cell wall biosynthesis
VPVVPRVSVVVPVLDDADRLRRCLDALAAQVDAPSYEVVVVDNGSADDSVAVARSHALQPVVLVEPRRSSYAARATGVARTRGSRLAFTDADCVPAPDWLAAGAARPEPVVGGAVRALASDRPTVWERYDRAVYLQQHEHVQEGFAATANLWVDRAAYDAVGGFDPALRSSGDLEWGRRATAAGFRVVHAPEVVVDHAPRTTALATWRLHRRLGAGWAVLARRGQGRPAWHDPALRIPLGQVVDAVNKAGADGPPLRRRSLAPVHALALTARWTGRLTAR